MAEPVTVSERRTKDGLAGGIYSNDVKTSRHHLYADEPVALGSADIGPTPFEYLAAALGSCTTITLRMYSERKKWDVEHISCLVKLHKDEGVQVFVREISVKGNLTDEARGRLVEIANKCPVHKVLTAGSKVQTVIV